MKNVIPTHKLSSALSDAPANIKMLSLDCFDTLIWRNVHAPRDVFADLGGTGPNKQQRIWAERHARSRTLLRHGHNEPAIADIYSALLPNHSHDERTRFVTAELEAEARHCYAFRPTVELIGEAKKRGLTVAIVSDTYLSELELAELIRSVAGEDLLAQVDHIFCSSAYGRAKSEGLFKDVIRKTKFSPAQILHIGDNPNADLKAAKESGLHALHLRQFNELVEQRLRLETAVGAIVNPSAGKEPPSYQAHRAAIALACPTLEDPASEMGYSSLGPVLHAFCSWLAEEAAELSKMGGRTHLLFLMRDGYLPQRVFEAMAAAPDFPCTGVEISRFTATAAGFEDRDVVLSYLEMEVEQTANFEALARQLLFSRPEILKLIGKLPGRNAECAFVSAVRTPENVRKIVKRAQALAQRLTAHVRREVNPAPGDTLVLVDLGYNGTVQDQVGPILERELGVRVAGRYLLLREQKISGRDKRGLIDHRHFDYSTIEALCDNVAVLEQLSTTAQGSVIDYDAQGSPIRNTNSIGARQSCVRDRVQEGCVRFAVERDQAFMRAPLSDGPESRRRAAAAVLARLMFVPLPNELEVLKAFEHDVNLGVGNTVKLFDPDVAELGLKRRGLFYMKGAERMYLPAELRGQGLPLSLTLLTQRRFGLDLRYPDFCDSGIDLPIIVADGNEVSLQSVKATPTHDGYFLAAIPIGECRYAIGVQFGRLYDWVQVDSVQFLPVASFLSKDSALLPPPVDGVPSLEGMEQIAPHLLRCDDEAAFMMVPPPGGGEGTPMMLTVVFRPIAARETPTARAGQQIAAGSARVAS